MDYWMLFELPVGSDPRKRRLTPRIPLENPGDERNIEGAVVANSPHSLGNSSPKKRWTEKLSDLGQDGIIINKKLGRRSGLSKKRTIARILEAAKQKWRTGAQTHQSPSMLLCTCRQHLGNVYKSLRKC